MAIAEDDEDEVHLISLSPLHLLKDVFFHLAFVVLGSYALFCLPQDIGIPLAVMVGLAYLLARRVNRAEAALSEERRAQEMEKEDRFGLYLGVLTAAIGMVVGGVFYFQDVLRPRIQPGQERHREQQELLQQIGYRLQEQEQGRQTREDGLAAERRIWGKAVEAMERRGELGEHLAALQARVTMLEQTSAALGAQQAREHGALETEQEELRTVVETLRRQLEGGEARQ